MLLTTSKLSVTIVGLRKFTNYSIQALAYTRTGEGVASVPLYVITQQDSEYRPMYLYESHVSLDNRTVSIDLCTCSSRTVSIDLCTCSSVMYH